MTRVQDAFADQDNSKLWRAKADELGQHGTDEWFVEYQIQKLQHYAAHGIPSCYESAEKMMYDFWPDFSWTSDRAVKQAQMLLKDSRFPAIQKTFLLEEHFDLEFELNEGINHLEDQDQAGKDIISKFIEHCSEALKVVDSYEVKFGVKLPSEIEDLRRELRKRLAAYEQPKSS